LKVETYGKTTAVVNPAGPEAVYERELNLQRESGVTRRLQPGFGS